MSCAGRPSVLVHLTTARQFQSDINITSHELFQAGFSVGCFLEDLTAMFSSFGTWFPWFEKKQKQQKRCSLT